MQNKKTAMITDIAYTILLILLFISTAFIVYSENVAFSMAALCIVFAIMIVTHFTSITAGLIINILAIFLTFSWALYQLLVNGKPIGDEIYFWLIISPFLTIISSTVFRNVQRIEEENKSLKKRVKQFSIVDEMTELKNIQAYEMEFPIYEKIAVRYNIGLTLLVWQFRYAQDLKKIIGNDNLDQTAVVLSKEIENVFRKEDVVYILNKDPYMWGILMLTQNNQEELLKERTREKLEKITLTEILGKNAPRMEVRIGTYYASETENALSMLEKAKNKLQYDV